MSMPDTTSCTSSPRGARCVTKWVAEWRPNNLSSLRQLISTGRNVGKGLSEDINQVNVSVSGLPINFSFFSVIACIAVIYFLEHRQAVATLICSLLCRCKLTLVGIPTSLNSLWVSYDTSRFWIRRLECKCSPNFSFSCFTWKFIVEDAMYLCKFERGISDQEDFLA